MYTTELRSEPAPKSRATRSVRAAPTRPQFTAPTTTRIAATTSTVFIAHCPHVVDDLGETDADYIVQIVRLIYRQVGLCVSTSRIRILGESSRFESKIIHYISEIHAI